MAHFAKVNLIGIVEEVLVVANEDLLDSSGVEQEQKGVELLQKLTGVSNWVQTSFNATFRKNYAGVGFSYDSTRDAFIPPKPHQSWVLNETTCRWDSPIGPKPQDGNQYVWDETTTTWKVWQP